MSQPAFDNSMVLPSHVGHRASRKIWLPNVVYESVPYFYILAGFAALFATLYINAWYWVVPHWILFTALCLHAGTRIIYKRYKYRTARRRAAEDA